MSPILRSGATGTRRRLVAIAIAVALASSLVAGQADPPLVINALADIWRWRRLEPPTFIDVVFRVRPGRDGQLIVSRNDGHDRYDGWRWWGLPYDEPEHPGKPLDIMPTDGGWVITSTNSIGTLSEADGVSRRLYEDTDHSLTCWSVVDPQGRVLIGVEGNIEEITLDARRPVMPGPPGEIRALSIDDDGRLLALTDEALWIYRDEWEQLTDESFCPREQGLTRIHRGGGALYIIPDTLGEVRGVVWRDGRLSSLPASERHRRDRVEDAAVAPDGTLLVATRDTFLHAYKGGAWTEIALPSPLNREHLRSICFVDEHRLVVSAASGDLWTCETGTRRWTLLGLGDIEDDLHHPMVNALAPDGQDGVWAATHRGLDHWDGERFDCHFDVAGDTGIELFGLTTVCRDDAGHVWLGSGSAFGGALELDPESGQWTHHTDPDGTSDFPIHKIRRAPDGALWFMLLSRSADFHHAGGVARLGPEGWQRWSDADGLPNSRTYDVAFPPDSGPVVATVDGLARYSDGRWHVIVDELAPLTRIFSLHVDGRGHLWAGRGLATAGLYLRRPTGWSRLDAERTTPIAAAEFAEDEQGRVYFASDTGLHRIEGNTAILLSAGAPVYNFWPILPDGDGGLFLGSKGGGLVHYRPDDDAAPHITHLDHDDRPGDTTLVVRWKGTDFWNVTPADSLHYEMKIDERAWMTVSSSSGEYVDSTLAPGEHSVSMRVTDGAGNTWTTDDPLIATIPDPWFWQRSKQVSAVMFVMALAVLAVTFFKRRLDQRHLHDLTQRLMTSQEDERRRISRDLHDDLGGLLTGVSLEIQTAERLDDPAKRSAALRRALQSSREALDHVRQISSLLRPTWLDDVGLREAVSSSLTEFRQRTSIPVHSAIDLDGAALSESVRGHLYRILQELLTNVTRHADARHVAVALTGDSQRVELSVRDDGRGFDPHRVPTDRHMGLGIMAERARQLRGRLDIDAAPGRGTTVRISIPLTGTETGAGGQP